jgi:cytochrome c
MKALLLAAALAAAGTTASAVDYAQVQPALHRNGCDGCHDVDTQVSGPSYHAIATRYATRPDVRTYLADKIRKGSVNTWGAAAMPPIPQIDDLELKNVVEWLATGAPGPDTPR